MKQNTSQKLLHLVRIIQILTTVLWYDFLPSYQISFTMNLSVFSGWQIMNVADAMVNIKYSKQANIFVAPPVYTM